MNLNKMDYTHPDYDADYDEFPNCIEFKAKTDEKTGKEYLEIRIR